MAAEKEKEQDSAMEATMAYHDSSGEETGEEGEGGEGMECEPTIAYNLGQCLFTPQAHASTG